MPYLTTSASVVIPAWDACETLEQCLIAIGQSSYNRKYSEQLEAVVVDNGSTDGTWDLLENKPRGVRIKEVYVFILDRHLTSSFVRDLVQLQ